MNDKISSYFPPPSPPDPPKKPPMSSSPPPDKPRKSKRPAKHTVMTYDYETICHLGKKCKKQAIECPKCLNDLVNRDGKSRLGHRTITIKIPWEETETHIKARVVIYHGHFAVLKHTHVPVVDVARNTCCDLGWKWLDKKYARLSWHVLRDKPLPPFALSDE
jgi:hypothetical protein